MKIKTAILFLITFTITGLVFFALVLHSNLALEKNVALAATSGHIVVPGPGIAASLGKIHFAVCSSLFITFTAGLFICVFISVVFVLFHTLGTNRTAFIKLLRQMAVPAISMGVCLVLFFVCADRSIFLRTRDYLLLSNPAGTAVSQAYYTFSPAAAHAVQPPLAKMVKLVWINPSVPHKEQISNTLARFGWFEVKDKTQTDFTITSAPPNDGHVNPVYRDQIRFVSNNTSILSVPGAQFLSNPVASLKQFSRKTDHTRFLRMLCLAGLVLAIPVCFFLFFYQMVSLALCLICPAKYKTVFAAIFMVAMTMGLIVFLYPGLLKGGLSPLGMLASDNAKIRIEGLRTLCHDKSGMADTMVFKNHIKSPYTAQRYWAVKGLAKSRAPESIGMLISMLDDPAVVVAGAAVSGLSRYPCTTQKRALFKQVAQTHEQWYVQVKALAALRKCHGK